MDQGLHIMRYLVNINGHQAEVWDVNRYSGDDPATKLIDGVIKQLHPNDSEEIVYSLQKYYNAEIVQVADQPQAS